jgi:hypothetical protein
MKNPNVQIIASLAKMLSEQEEMLEERERDVDRVYEEKATLQDTLDKVRGELLELKLVAPPISNFEKGLVRARLDVFILLAKRPEVLAQAAAYMMSADRGLSLKIANIKRIREICGLGLKEAKDFVESFDLK